MNSRTIHNTVAHRAQALLAAASDFVDLPGVSLAEKQAVEKLTERIAREQARRNAERWSEAK